MSRGKEALRLQMIWAVDKAIDNLPDRPDEEISPDRVYQAFSGVRQEASAFWIGHLKDLNSEEEL